MPKTNALHGLTILDAIDSPHLLGAAFKDPASWAPWRAFLAALFGLPMDDASTALYRACTGRTAPPAQLFQFAWLVIGRRGGKSFTMALVAVFLALFRDWRPFLSPGERAVIQIVAADREQAKIIRRYVAGILQASRLLAQFIESETADGLELRGGVVIEVATRSFRTVRGRSVAVAILDELAYWRADDSANPDVEVLNAMRAAQATFGDSAVMIAASSPYSRRGVLWDAYRKFYGKDDAQNLVWQAATRQMNPQVPQSFIDSETERRRTRRPNTAPASAAI